MHRLLLVPPTLALVGLAPIILMMPPVGAEFLTGHDLFARLLHAAAIIAFWLCSLWAYLRGAYRMGAALGAIFLGIAIIRLLSLYSGILLR